MHDVIIAGGGVAGCRLASRLGMDVLLLEADKKITLKDSGIVSPRYIDIFGHHLIEHEIKIMEAVSPSGKTFSLNSEKPFAYLIDRIKFSKFLRKEARKKAKIKYEFVKDVIYGKDSATVVTNKGEHQAKMVIGCDGTLSNVRKAAGIQPPKMYAGILVRAKGIKDGNIKVFLNKFFSPEFFSWLIPQNGEYGIITGIRPREHLDYFKESLKLPDGKIYSYVIPLGSTKSYADRTLLVGDACGQSKPITGGGIIFSLRATRHAEEAVKQAVKKNNFSGKSLKRYEDSWKKEMASEIAKQVVLRKIYRNMGNNDIEKFFDVMGKHVEAVKNFDYDHITDLWKKMPVIETARYIIPRIRHVI